MSKTLPLRTCLFCQFGNSLVYFLCSEFDCIHSHLSVKMIDDKKKNVTVPKPDTQEQLLNNSKLQGCSMYIKLQQDDIYIYAFMNQATAITFCFIFLISLFYFLYRNQLNLNPCYYLCVCLCVHLYTEACISVSLYWY